MLGRCDACDEVAEVRSSGYAHLFTCAECERGFVDPRLTPAAVERIGERMFLLVRCAVIATRKGSKAFREYLESPTPERWAVVRRWDDSALRFQLAVKATARKSLTPFMEG